MKQIAIVLALWFGTGVAVATLYQLRHPRAFTTERHPFDWDNARYLPRVLEPDPFKAASCVTLWPICGLLFLGEEIVNQ